MEQKHTPLPWIMEDECSYGWDIHAVDEDHTWVGDAKNNHDNQLGFPPGKEGLANARLIIRACNSHYKLLEACKEIFNVLTEPGMMDVDEWKAWKRRAELMAHKAIALTEKE